MEKDNVVVQYDPKTGRLRRIEVDQNKNGKFDTWTYTDGTRIDRIEVDKDEDGRIERWEYYIDNKLSKVGSSSRGDGVVDEWAYADATGALKRVETDTDRDGHIDKWESFAPPDNAGGVPRLVSVELDTQKRGAPTQRLTYRPDGSLERVENLSADRR